jgi:LCP family protein required for cell wall assembly
MQRSKRRIPPHQHGMDHGSNLALRRPGLPAVKTVSLFLGVPVQYYVQVDFDTFVSMVKLIGGIDVYIDKDYKLKRLGGGRDVIRITCCGMRHLGGEATLAYARCRSESQGCDDGDVGRSKRQQQVIFGIRDKVLNPRLFPELMSRAPELWNTLQAGIQTNIALRTALLAALMREIPMEQIQTGVIDDHMVNFGNVTAGSAKRRGAAADPGQGPRGAQSDLHHRRTGQPDCPRRSDGAGAGGCRTCPGDEQQLHGEPGSANR